MATDFPNIFDYISQDDYIAYSRFRDTLSTPALRAVGKALARVKDDKVAQAYSRYFALDATLSSIITPYKPSCFDAWERAADEARKNDPIRKAEQARLDEILKTMPQTDGGF